MIKENICKSCIHECEDFSLEEMAGNGGDVSLCPNFCHENSFRANGIVDE